MTKKRSINEQFNSSFYDFSRKSKVVGDKAYTPTVVNVTELDDNGNSVVVMKNLESMLEPLNEMVYSDYSIGMLLKHGIPLKSIRTISDNRIGSEAQLEIIDQYMESHANELFNDPD